MRTGVWLGVGGYGGMVEFLVDVTRVCTTSSTTPMVGEKTKATTFSAPKKASTSFPGSLILPPPDGRFSRLLTTP